MSPPPLATPQQFADFMGDETLATNATAILLLDMASGLVRNEARQYFTYVEDDTVKLEGGHPFLYLPELPVTAVSNVTGMYYATTADPFYYDIPDAAALFGPLPPGIWVLDAHHRLRLPVGSIWPPVVQVTYSHGYADIPSDVQMVVMSAVARRWNNPKGYERWAIGGVNYQMPSVRSGAAAGTIGGLTLNADEQRILARYRNRTNR